MGNRKITNNTKDEINMSKDLNRYECIGRLGQDPESRFDQNGKEVVSFSAAVSKTWKDKQSGQKQEKTQWVKFVAFEPLSKIISQYLKKGSRAYLSGELVNRSWDDKDGNKRYVTEIVAGEMQMLDSRDNSQQSQKPAQQAQATQQAPSGMDAFDEDSIPF